METAEWIAAVGVVTLIACVVQVLTGQWLTGMQWVSVVKDLAMAGAAFLAAYVGWRGLSTWERQLKGNAEFECAQASALSANADQAAMAEEIRQLKADLERAKGWETERQRYTLFPIRGGGVLYAVKFDQARAGEPPHYLCTNCYEQGRKSIVSISPDKEGWGSWACPVCKSRVPTGYRGGSQAKFAGQPEPEA